MPRENQDAEPERVEARFALFRIFRQRRVLISSWALLAQGILLSAFDAVGTFVLLELAR